MAVYRVALLDGGCIFADEHINVTNEDYSRSRLHGNVCGHIIKNIAPSCHLISIKVTEHNCCTNELLCRGLVWCLFNNVDIINISLGLPYITYECRDIISKLLDKGVKIVCASGNNCVCYPSKLNGVISVGACNEDGKVTDYTVEDSYDVLRLGSYEYKGKIYHGTSFACARYTAKLCGGIEK